MQQNVYTEQVAKDFVPHAMFLQGTRLLENEAIFYSCYVGNSVQNVIYTTTKPLQFQKLFYYSKNCNFESSILRAANVDTYY